MARLGTARQVAALRRRGGRRPLGSAPGEVVPVRLDPELRTALAARARAEHTNASDVIRQALRAWLDIAELFELTAHLTAVWVWKTVGGCRPLLASTSTINIKILGAFMIFQICGRPSGSAPWRPADAARLWPSRHVACWHRGTR